MALQMRARWKSDRTVVATSKIFGEKNNWEKMKRNMR
jgi:hypothetical protein